jgi:hypothetical protein
MLLESRLSSALLSPHHALLFALAFGCSWAVAKITKISAHSVTHQEVRMEATESKKVRCLPFDAVAAFLATVADCASGVAASG